MRNGRPRGNRCWLEMRMSQRTQETLFSLNAQRKSVPVPHLCKKVEWYLLKRRYCQSELSKQLQWKYEKHETESHCIN